MQNQQNKNFQQSLDDYRCKIDQIDEKILELLSERLKIVFDVKKLKEKNGEKFFIKSARESDMIKNLIKKKPQNLSDSLIVDIWRKIITAANISEQQIKIALHNPKKIADFQYILREFYSDSVPIIEHDSAANVISEIEKNQAQIAVFEIPCENAKEDIDENWWINLANNKTGIKIFAKLPFFENKNGKNLFALAIKEQEKSSSDNSLLYIETKKEISKNQLLSTLKEIGFDAQILKSTNIKQLENLNFNLIEVKGFFDENNEKIETLRKHQIKAFVKILGNYPVV